MTAITLSPPRLGASYKFIWGLAAFGTALISGTFAALLPIFYQDYLGLAARWIAIGATIYAIWNAINDPLFGYITDSTRIEARPAHPLHAFHRAVSGPHLHPGMAGAEGRPAACAVCLDAGHDAALRHVLHDHRAGLFRAAARSDRIGRRPHGSPGLWLALRPAGHAARLHHSRAVPAQGGRLAVCAAAASRDDRRGRRERITHHRHHPQGQGATRVHPGGQTAWGRPGDPLHVHQPIIPHPGRRQFYVDPDAGLAARHPLLPGRLRAANELDDRAGGGLHPADHRRARVEPDPGAAGGRPRTATPARDRRGRADPADGRPRAANPGLPGAGRLRAGRPADADQRPLCPGGRRGRAAVGGAPRGRLLRRQRHAHQAGAVAGPDPDAFHSGGDRLHHAADRTEAKLRWTSRPARSSASGR